MLPRKADAPSHLFAGDEPTPFTQTVAFPLTKTGTTGPLPSTIVLPRSAIHIS
jgi:hypothetical protein